MNWPHIANGLHDRYVEWMRTDMHRGLSTFKHWVCALAKVAQAKAAAEPDTNPGDERERLERRRAWDDKFCLDVAERDRAGR